MVHCRQRVSELLAAASPKTNEILLKGGKFDTSYPVFKGQPYYAPGVAANTALADAYLKVKSPNSYLRIAAARTGDPRCAKIIRAEFEREAVKLLDSPPDGQQRDGLVGVFHWILIAGVEVADDSTVPLFVKLVAMTEEMRQAEEIRQKARIKRGDFLGEPRSGTTPASSAALSSRACVSAPVAGRGPLWTRISATRRSGAGNRTCISPPWRSCGRATRQGSNLYSTLGPVRILHSRTKNASCSTRPLWITLHPEGQGLVCPA